MSGRRHGVDAERTARLRRAVLAGCAFTALAALSCAGLLAAAVFVPAPVAVLPLLVSVGIGVPMFATWELSRRVRGLAGNDDRPSVVAGDDDWPDAVAGDDAPDAGAAVSGASAARAIADLRRALARLPETRHPLDF